MNIINTNVIENMAVLPNYEQNMQNCILHINNHLIIGKYRQGTIMINSS